MTEPITAPPIADPTSGLPIVPDAPVYNASLVKRVDETESLAYFWVRFDGEPTPFEAGQYMTIGVTVGEQIVQRPYSVASPPAVAGTEGYEFYVRRVQGGTFTPLLFDLPVGHRMRMIGPKGKFMLQPDDDRTHIFISSGTGNAPFVSMMRQLLIDGRPRPVVFLNGVSYASELGYRERVEGWARSGEYPVTFVPTVSRPAGPVQRRLDGPDRSRRDDPGARARRARPDAGQLDRLHLRQPGHDPVGRGDVARPAATPRSRSTRSSTGPRARSPAAWPAPTSPRPWPKPRRTRTSSRPPGRAPTSRARASAPGSPPGSCATCASTPGGPARVEPEQAGAELS